jgi:hypothetical protein
MLTKQLREFERWADEQEKTKKIRKINCIDECIEILTKEKKSIDRSLMWNESLMHEQYVRFESQSERLAEIINYLKSKI